MDLGFIGYNPNNDLVLYLVDLTVSFLDCWFSSQQLGFLLIILFKTFHSYVWKLSFAPIPQCTSAIAQLTKGRSKEEKEGPQLQSLAAKALEKDYKQRAPDKLSQLTTALKSLTLSSWCSISWILLLLRRFLTIS